MPPPTCEVYTLARAMVRAFTANTLLVYGWLNRTNRRDPRIAADRTRRPTDRTRGRDSQTATPDLQCISWMLQTSLDKATLLLSLKLLTAMTTMAGCSPALVSACIDILASCVSILGGRGVVILQGSEELAAQSALCCLHILSHLTTVDPASGVFDDMRKQYSKTFPIWIRFDYLLSYHRFGGLLPYHRFSILHHIFHPSRKLIQSRDPSFLYSGTIDRERIRWQDYKLFNTEHVALVQLARFEYQRKQYQKIPRWILHYANHLLSQDPLPLASDVAGCLSIIAMDLGCTLSDYTTHGVYTASNATILDERYANI